MNKKELIATRTKNKRLLEPSSWKNINRIEIDIGNSVEHELTKCVCFILLRNGIPANNLQELFVSYGQNELNSWRLFIDMIKDWNNLLDVLISKYGQKYEKEWQRPYVVTEARFKNGRRADLFILDTGEIIEIETNHKIKKKNAITIYI